MEAQVAHITTTEVARRAQVQPGTVRRWVERGYLTPSMTTPGGHYRFDPDAVDRLLGIREGNEAKAAS